MNDPDNSDTDGDDGDNDELSFGLPCCSLLFKLYIYAFIYVCFAYCKWRFLHASALHD